MVDEGLAEKCRKWVEEYCGANQSSPNKYNRIEQNNQRSIPVHSSPNRLISTNRSRFRRTALKYGLCLIVVIGMGIFCYDKYWNGTPQQSRLEVVTNSYVSSVNESQKKLAYFNDLYNSVIELTKQGKLEEADQLSSRLKQEIQEAKKEGLY